MKNPIVKVPGHRIAVKPDDVEIKRASGLILAIDEKLEKAAMVQGQVKAIGPDAWKTMYINGYQGEPWASIGDTVIYAKYVGFEVAVGDEIWRILNDEDIVCVFPKQEELTGEPING